MQFFYEKQDILTRIFKYLQKIPISSSLGQHDVYQVAITELELSCPIFKDRGEREIAYEDRFKEVYRICQKLFFVSFVSISSYDGHFTLDFEFTIENSCIIVQKFTCIFDEIHNFSIAYSGYNLLAELLLAQIL